MVCTASSLNAGMITGGNPQEDGEKNPKNASRSWGTTISGQSLSTSGSVGLPSSRSEAGLTTAANESTLRKLGHLEIQGDDTGSQGAIVSRKKKRGQRAAGGDESGRGLWHFCMKVCEKVESKGRTTYNEVPCALFVDSTQHGHRHPLHPSRSCVVTSTWTVVML